MKVFALYIHYHYKLSNRDDSKFWKYIKNNLKVSSEQKKFLKQAYPSFFKFSVEGILEPVYKELTEPSFIFPEVSWIYMFIGYNKKINKEK